jgi:hypothetical protein
MHHVVTGQVFRAMAERRLYEPVVRARNSTSTPSAMMNTRGPSAPLPWFVTIQ